VTADLREELQSTLGSRYTLEQELGGGGMARVFVAEERALGQRVVVKILPLELAVGVNPERFRREIAFAARLQHPHIVPLLTAGELPGGLPYFTMPYVDGESLRATLSRQDVLPLSMVLRVLRDVASALEHAHSHGVVHRDIKLDNILLSGGYALVLDFGVARALIATSDAGRAAELTSVGFVVGTPAYTAPE